MYQHFFRLLRCLTASGALTFAPVGLAQSSETAQSAPTADLGPLLGLVVVDDPAEVITAGRPGVRGVDVSQAGALADAGLVAKLQAAIGQPLDKEMIPTLRQIVGEHYADSTALLVRLVLPVQEVQDGVLQILLVRTRVGQVNIEGQKWFKEARYRSALGVSAGEDFYPGKLNAGLERINTNSFRAATAELAPGAEPGLTDITLRVQDRLPVRLSAGYNDSGTVSTGADRVFTGVTWGDAFGRDDTLSYNFNTTPGTNVLRSHTLGYAATLPWKHELSFNASYSDMRSILPPPFDQRGQSRSAGLRYAVMLPDLGPARQGLSFSADYKRSDSNLLFSSMPVFGSVTEIVQGTVGYNYNRPDKIGSTMFDLALTGSPGGLAGRNHTADFQSQRAGASARYASISIGLARTTALPGQFVWRSSIRGQLATDNLLGSEQLGLGGAASLRGYEEGEVYADQGVLLRNEVNLPPLRFGRDYWRGLAQSYLFWDYGYGLVKNPLPGEKDRFSLSSVGAGLRFGVNRHFSLGFDYGWQLIETGLNSLNRSSRGHLNANLSW